MGAGLTRSARLPTESRQGKLTEPDRSRSVVTNPKAQELTGRRRDLNGPVAPLEEGARKRKKGLRISA